MAYRLKLGEAFGKGVRRVLREQIDAVESALGPSDDIDTGIHESRKSMKRARAALALVRPVLDRRQYRREDARYRDIGRLLSEARDARVMLDTIGRLEERFPEAKDHPVLRRLAADRLARSLQHREDLDRRRLRQIRSELAAARRAIDDLSIEGKRLSIILPGLEQTYAKARKMAKRAERFDHAEDFHEWRKHVQRHWRHLVLLERAWSEIMIARAASARELSDLLGWDHDLAMLAQAISAEAGVDGEAGVALKLCDTLQHELRARALPIGARLFAERPEELGQRVSVYWKASRRLKRAAGSAQRAPANGAATRGD